jgi:outer membrane receptor protein involved in Fe transport
VSTRASAAYLIDYDNGDGNFAGTFSELVSGSSLPRWRVREELGYAVPAFQVRGAANFVSGMTDRNRGSVFTVPNAKGYDGITPDYVTFDLFAKVRVMPKMDLTVGVNNIGDRQPPYAYSALYNTLVSTYDLVGRYFYAEARVRF